ncbi:SDR family oxidoreductase [Agrobacterium vaccinii]|uniref:SDR family oxidoreductase n=1 Tax=Agrobacterium vaccinii TaxID=2735528 RepID=UPI001E4DA80A|nr:SDR family oxidoreductase [Agrobacterium vaccinii]UHS59784.1 SDR family oxidoreductase [Agrobacterium vaccinii]
MDLGVKGRRAIVCGGSKGISRAAARRLSLEGAEVILVARTPETLAETAHSIMEESGVAVQYFATDLTLPNGRQALLEAHPTTDILVANSGVPQSAIPYKDLTSDDWNWWMEAHFHSAMGLIYGYAPGMCERRFGRIVNISVSFIKFPQVNVGHSHAARLALAGAIGSLVREIAPHNVTINSVLPGLINTDALHEAIRGMAEERGVSFETVEAELRSSNAANRIADPQEAGDLIAMLCAEQMGFMTGQNIVSDGGAYQGIF